MKNLDFYYYYYQLFLVASSVSYFVLLLKILDIQLKFKDFLVIFINIYFLFELLLIVFIFKEKVASRFCILCFKKFFRVSNNKMHSIYKIMQMSNLRIFFKKHYF